MKKFLFFVCIVFTCFYVNAQTIKSPEKIKKEKEEALRKKLGVSGFTITKHKNGIIRKKGEVFNVSRFNRDGKLVYKKIFIKDINSEQPKQFQNSKTPENNSILHVAEYEYDDNGYLIKEISSNKSNNVDYIILYEYDNNSNLAKASTYTKNRKEGKETLKNIKIYNELHATSYNDKGDTLSVSVRGYTEKENKFIAKDSFFKSNAKLTKTYVLNKKGLIQQSKNVMNYPFGAQQINVSYQYDLNNNIIKSIYNSNFPFGRQRVITDFEYDDSNGLIFKKISFDKEKNEKTTLVYKYEFFEN